MKALPQLLVIHEIQPYLATRRRLQFLEIVLMFELFHIARLEVGLHAIGHL